MKIRTFALLSTIIALILVSGLAIAQGNPPGTPPPRPGNEQGGGAGQNRDPLTVDTTYQVVESTYTGIASVSIGIGESLGDLSLTTECSTGERFVAAESGLVIAEDGTEWVVPMVVNEGAGTVDMFNNCTGNGDNPDFLDELETVVVDADGDEITGFIFGDNYFELYINEEFIGRDTIGFVPFNSSAVRFQVDYPYTIAVHLADWETHPGIGMEYDNYHVGDAGFIARFSDGTITSNDWVCKPIYIAPLDDPACVVEDEFDNADSSACSANPTCSTSNPDMCRGLHYELEEDWSSVDFNDSNWLNASLYDASEVTNQRGYVDYADIFGEADFIWSSNLDLDNGVVCRYTVEAPSE